MSETINSYCDICGRGYHVCNSCNDIVSFTPWRTITDTVDHYKIFLVLSNYNKTKDKEKAKQELESCDLSELDSFRPEIKNVINEIMSEEKKDNKIDNTVKVKVSEKAEPVKKTVRKTTVKKDTSDVNSDEVNDNIE